MEMTDIENCEGAMLPLIAVGSDKHLELFDAAVDCVSYSTGIDRQSILGKSRKRPIADARMMLYKIARNEIGSPLGGQIPTYNWIGEQFDPPKDHGTILHGVRQLRDRIETSKSAKLQFLDALMQFDCDRALVLRDQIATGVSDGVTALKQTITSLRCKMQRDADTLKVYLEALAKSEGRDNESMVQDKLASDG